MSLKDERGHSGASLQGSSCDTSGTRCQQRPSSQQCLPHSVLKSWWPIPVSVFPPTSHWTPQNMSRCKKQVGWAGGGQRQEGLRLWGGILHTAGPELLVGVLVFQSVWEKGQSIPSSSRHSLQTRSRSQESPGGSRDEEGQVGTGQSSSQHGPCAAPEPPALPWQQPSHVLLSLAVLHPVSCAVRAHLSQGLSSPN